MNPTLHQLHCEIAAALDTLTAAQTQLRLLSGGPKRWTIQQIVEHLLLTYAATAEILEARLAKGSPTRATPSFVQRIAQGAVIEIGYFPHGRKAPAPVTPAEDSVPLSGEELAHATLDRLKRLDLACKQANELFGSTAPCASHLILGPLNIEQWRTFQLRHGRHHIKQIEAIRRAHHLF